MTRHFLPWSCVLLVLLGALVCSVTTMATTCRLLRYGKLTMFSGETANVEMPCNYRMVNMTCGGQQIEVIAGSESDPEFHNRFSPSAIRLTVRKDNRVIHEIHNPAWELRNEAVDATGPTSQTSKVEPTAAGSTVTSSWVDTILVPLPFVPVLRSAGHSAAEPKTQTSREDLSAIRRGISIHESQDPSTVLMSSESVMIAFSTGHDDSGITITCMAPDFSNEPYPNSLCGDGLTKNVIRDRKDELFSNVITPFMQNARSTTIFYDVLSQTGFPQWCNAAYRFSQCKIREKAVESCAPLWVNRTLSKCMLPLNGVWDEDARDNGVSACLTKVCGSGTACDSFIYRDDFSPECKDAVLRDFYRCE